MSNLLSALHNYMQNFEMYFYLNKKKNKNVSEKFGHPYMISDKNHGNLKKKNTQGKIRELFFLTSVATLIYHVNVRYYMCKKQNTLCIVYFTLHL